MFEFELLSKFINNKVICVTGAGGSIGSELSTQILLHRPKKVILLDRSEINLYNIREKIDKNNKDYELYKTRAKLNYANDIFKIYDKSVNKKYKVEFNNKTINRIKNSF